MSSLIMLILTAVILGTLCYLEERDDQISENAHIRQMIKESRIPKPTASRNPTRYGEIGYRLPRRRSVLWRLLN